MMRKITAVILVLLMAFSFSYFWRKAISFFVHEQLGHAFVCQFLMHGKTWITESEYAYTTYCVTRSTTLMPLFALAGILAELFFALIFLFVPPASFVGGVIFFNITEGFLFKNYWGDLSQVGLSFLCTYPYSNIIFAVGLIVLIGSLIVSIKWWNKNLE